MRTLRLQLEDSSRSHLRELEIRCRCEEQCQSLQQEIRDLRQRPKQRLSEGEDEGEGALSPEEEPINLSHEMAKPKKSFREWALGRTEEERSFLAGFRKDAPQAELSESAKNWETGYVRCTLCKDKGPIKYRSFKPHCTSKHHLVLKAKSAPPVVVVQPIGGPFSL